MAGSSMFGRDEERESVLAFLDATESSRVLVLEGEAGIGKTTLWKAGIDAARGRGLCVLSAQPSGAVAQLSFAALTDLLDGVDLTALEGLPPPQLRALEVALLRAEPLGVAPERRAIALGFLNSLRVQARQEPLLVAIDDLQWLDPASADALAFAADRLERDPIAFLLARRSGSPSVLEQALERRGLQRLVVGPLSLDATRRLLSERLGLSVSRRVLRRIVELAGGNPLFALELGRKIVEQGPPEIGEEVPVPGAVEDLLGTRVLELPAPVRRLLLALALSADLHASELRAIAEPDVIDDATDRGLLLVEEDRVRAAHPLLAAAARERAPAGEQRALHRALASVVGDEALQARHLALATERPDASLAGMLAAAGAYSLARGATEDAVELAEHALRVTPKTAADRPERLLALADYLAKAGEHPRLAELLTGRADEVPPGALRARFHLILGKASDHSAHEEHLERAWTESENEPALHALVLATKAALLAGSQVERIEEAEAWAAEAHGLAGADPYVVYALAWCRLLRGSPFEELRTAAPAATYLESLDRLQGIRLAFRGEIHDAQAMFGRLLALADERGEAGSYAVLQLQRCELELRAGRTAAASRLLDEWERFSGQWGLSRARCEALLTAIRGLADDAEHLALAAIAATEAPEHRWNLLESLRARVIAALLAHEPARAAESLRRVWEHMRREGVDDPGAFPVATDLVEALVELGETAEALAVTGRLAELAEQQEHPWGLASAQRCDALVRLAAHGYEPRTAERMVAAADRYRQLGLRFDEARTLLALGRAQRRHRKWAAARASLEHAAATFDEIGSTGWADDARLETERVGGRRPRAESELTPSEQRVAALAAEGLANKEIAQALSVSVHTVEIHLSHAYAKLGVRSRSQLAASLGARASPSP